ITDASHAPIAERDPEAYAEAVAMGFASAIVVPLATRGRTLGALTFIVGHGRAAYTEADLAFSQELASRAANAVDNALLYDAAQQAIRVRDDFLSIASHELRTPLTPLTLHLQDLRRRMHRGWQLPAPLPARVDAMYRQVLRLQRMVTSLLDISKLTSGQLHLEPEELDLAALAREVVERFAQQETSAGAPLHLEVPERLIGVWDALRLDQVLSNLIGNALKFGERRPVDVRIRGGDAEVLIEVRDRGIGIAPADQSRIFEQFERAVATRHYSGFGLGLWITRQIVEAMGGHIGVESAPGEGSTFRVVLPRRLGRDDSHAPGA
ncbi:MAG: ATP-binding protein, partial [Myxococcales bacterium]